LDAALNNVERRNARKCVAGEALFGTGMGFLSSVAVLPLLLKSLGAGEVLLGLLGSIFWAGWLVLQPLGLFLFGGKPRSKRFLVPWSLAFAVPSYLAVGVLVFLLGPTRPALCVTLVLVVLAVRILGGGMVMPFWWNWQAVIFRQAIRGRVTGLMAGAFLLGMAASALVAGRAVEAIAFPLNYAILGFVSVAFFSMALSFHYSVREPDVLSEPRERTPAGEMFRFFYHSLSEPNFRNYLVGRLLMTLGAGGAAFYAVHFESTDGGGLAAGTVIMLSGLMGLAQGLSSFWMGRMGDRSGHKAGILVGAAAQLAAAAVAWLGSGGVACGTTFVLLGVACAAAWVSHMNMLFETCPHESHVAHITLSNIVLGPVIGLVPILTGQVNELVGRRAGIGLTLIPAALGVLWLILAVREPRDIEMARPQRETANGQVASGAAS